MFDTGASAGRMDSLLRDRFLKVIFEQYTQHRSGLAGYCQETSLWIGACVDCNDLNYDSKFLILQLIIIYK